MAELDLGTVRRIASEGVAHLLVGWRREAGGFELRRVDTSVELAERLRTAVVEFCDQVAMRRVVPLEVGRQPGSGEAMGFEGVAAVAAELLEGAAHPEAVERFVPLRDAEEVSFQAVSLVGEGAAVLALHRSNPARLLGGSRMTAVLQEGRAESLAAPVLTLEPAAEVLVHGDRGLTVTAADVPALFPDLPTLGEAVAADVAAVTARAPLANPEELAEACRRDFRMMAKLHQVAARPYLEEVTVERLRRLVADHGLPPEVIDDAGRLVYHPHPERRWLLLQLLDDDFLESPVTRRRYQVSDKQPLEA